MAWLDSVNREREQRGVPPLQRCAVSTQRDVFTLPWEDLVYPQYTSRPRATSKEEVKTGTCPTVKPPPSLNTDQSGASDGDDSEGEYVELTDRPLPRLSPQKGSLTQSISQLFGTRTPADTLRHPQNSEHNATQCAAHNTTTQPTTECTTTQTAASNTTTQPATHTSTTQPATHSITTQTPASNTITQPATHTSATQPATHSTTTQTAANNITHAAAHNTTHNTHPSEHDTSHNAERLTDHSTSPTTQPVAHDATQSAACDTAHNTTQPSEHNVYNTTPPADLKVLHSLRQATDPNSTHIANQRSLHTRTQPSECNTTSNSAQPDTHTPKYSNTCLDKLQSDNLTHSSVKSSLVEEEHSAATIHTMVSSSTLPEEESLYCEEQLGGNGLMKGCSTDHIEEQDQEMGISLKSLRPMEDELKEEQHRQQVSCGSEEQESKSEEKEQDTSEEVTASEGTEEVEVEEEVQLTIVPLRQERNDTAEHEKESGPEGGKHFKETYSETSAQLEHMHDSYCNTFTHVQNISSETTTICKTARDSYSEDYGENTNAELPYFEIKLEKDSGGSENDREFHAVSDFCGETHTQPTYTQISSAEESEVACETVPQPPVTDSSAKNKQAHSEDFSSEDTHTQKLCKYPENNTQLSQTDSHREDSLENACSYFENTALAQPEDPCEKPLQGTIVPQTATEDIEHEKTHGCQEVGHEGGEGAKHQDKGFNIQSEDNASAAPCQTEPPATVSTVPEQPSESSQSRFYRMLLRSGAVCLPGVRDRGGRPLLTVCSYSSIWAHPLCNTVQLFHLLLYYTSTLGTELRTSGLTVLVDARRAAPSSILFSALRALQEDSATSIHSVLILTNKESTLRLDKPAATQVEVLTSVRSLQKHVELKQLPLDFGGTFNFNQSSWISFRARVDQLTNQCKDVIDLLQKTITALQDAALPAAAQDAEQLLVKNKALMQDVLQDGRLVRLQQEGGALLSRLRKEEGGGDAAEDQRAAVDTVSALYEEVDELLHRLVTLSNARTQELGFIVDFKELEEGFGQVSSWMQEVGEPSLQTLNEPEDSLERLVMKQQTFKEFYSNAYDHCKHGEELLTRMERWSSVPSADLSAYGATVTRFCSQLHDFSRRVHTTGHSLDRVVKLYRFLDQAYGWALAGMRFLSNVSMEDCALSDKCQAVISCLEDYQRQHPPITDAHFQEMKITAGELRGEQGLRHWSFAWSKCQEAKRMLDRKMEAALRTRDAAHRSRSDSATNRITMPFRRTLSELWGLQESPSSSSQKDAGMVLSRCTSTVATSISTPSTPGLPQHLQHSSCNESSDRLDVLGTSPSLSTCSLASSRRQQLRKTQSLDCPSTSDVSRYSPSSRALSEPVRTGNTGVFIKGLEVSSMEAADRTLFHRTPAHSWGGYCPSPRTPGTPRASSSPAAELRPRGSKLRHIVQEMVTTEREYVRSLSYIMDQYFPEMERADLPQDLRGKRSVVFGNLEKLLDFHSQFFLKELESCWRHPLRVSHCFLRHQEQFSLYALYSKNKPKSDALLASHGHSFFRRKQMQLGDKMDLSSYLLKPVQRMSKYALLLSDLMKEVGSAQEAELVSLQAATNMVKFQLRHGNDLLAMDAIRDCDVNLKEQGQLIRQEEFIVCTGRRKCQRRIFLFEELVLFSKPKKVDGSLDVFTYKHSFKTADVGLTESTGDSGLQFEIWFRRRTSRNQTFILQASTAEIRQAWTSDIARILWTQATKNKEMRLKEMVSMGVGNKPYLDIQPSDAAISDRAVHYIKSRGARTRASIAVSVLDHINPFKRGVVTSDLAALAPSSCSLLGPLNLHMFSQSQNSSATAAEASFSSSCIEEDEQEHETSSQPSMTTESSGSSSSHCLSGSTGSDSGCVSSHLQEAQPEEANKQRLNSNFISAEASPALSPATVV